MSGTLTIPVDATLEEALAEQAKKEGKTEPEVAREILDRALAVRGRPKARHRRQEHEWRRTHQDVLLRYAGEWVVLEGEEIVVHGDNPERLVEEARDKGVQVPYIFFVEPLRPDIVKIGL